VKQLFVFLAPFLLTTLPTVAFNGIEIAGAVSQLAPHTTKMFHIKSRPAPLFMVFLHLPWTDSMWHDGFASLTVHFHDNGNAQILGKSYGLSVSWNFTTKNNRFQFKMGTGLALLTKKYNFYSNRENVSIGSHLNNVTYFFSGYKFSRITIGVGVLHYSAGALSMPNLGLNYPFAMVIYQVQERTNHEMKHRDIVRRANISNRFIYEFGVGVSANMPPGAPSAPVIVSSFNKHFPMGKTISIAPSLYVELNFRAIMFYHLFKWQQWEGSLSQSDRLLLGLRTGPEFILSATMGRVVLSGTAGWYLHNKLPAPASLFNRLYLTYWLTEKVGLSVMVKAHLMAAEFTSLNLAIKI